MADPVSVPLAEPLVYRFHSTDPATAVSFHAELPVELLRGSNRLVVLDANTRRLVAAAADAPVVLHDRDQAKSWPQVELVLQAAVDRALDRHGEIVAIGGGAVCDVAAFAASILLRGVRLTLIPTTLTAMVDAALGGKTGINLGGSKNMVGTFYPAHRLVVVPAVVSHLTDRDYRSGLAEVIKTAMLGDAGLFDLLEQRRAQVEARDGHTVAELVRRCLEVKARFVVDDLREEADSSTAAAGDAPVRAYLNLGHTFAHALESVSGFAWTHGEAVAWGLGCAMRLGRHLGVTDPDYAARVLQLLQAYQYRLQAPEAPADDLIGAMAADKKRRGQDLRFVLQRDIERTELRAVTVADVRRSLHEQ